MTEKHKDEIIRELRQIEYWAQGSDQYYHITDLTHSIEQRIKKAFINENPSH